MAGHNGDVVSLMMDVLAGGLTRSQFGTGAAGPDDPDRKSGCGHLPVTIDIARTMPRAKFGRRPERLIEQITSEFKAAAVGERFSPQNSMPAAAHSRRCAASCSPLRRGGAWPGREGRAVQRRRLVRASSAAQPEDS
jgi:LDH2 family malate/lactate/ureidoglycolate dehydrogenase